MVEGEAIQLSGTASDEPGGQIIQYEWDLDYDGQTFTSDAQGVAPTFSAAAIDGPAARTIALRVTAADGATAIATGTITITDAPLLTSLSGSVIGVRQQPLSFAGSFTDGPMDTQCVAWDFGDGTVIAVPSGDAGASTVAHRYTVAGTYTVTMTVTNDDGLSSVSAQTVRVKPLEMLPNAVDADQVDLIVGGTAGNDSILFLAMGRGRVAVLLNGRYQGVFNPTGQIAAYGGDGNDVIATGWTHGPADLL